MPCALTGGGGARAQHKPQGAPLQAGNRSAVTPGPAFRPVFAGRMDCFGPQPEYIPCPCSSATVCFLAALQYLAEAQLSASSMRREEGASAVNPPPPKQARAVMGFAAARGKYLCACVLHGSFLLRSGPARLPRGASHSGRRMSGGARPRARSCA